MVQHIVQKSLLLHRCNMMELFIKISALALESMAISMHSMVIMTLLNSHSLQQTILHQCYFLQMK